MFALLSLTVALGVVPANEVTWTRDVAPIVYKNCTSCHRPGEVGPFPLLTWKDAAKRADFLASITAERRMPPWKPEPGFGSFHDERRLSDAEIKTLARWAETGTKEGDPKDLAPLPKFTDGWQLGEPDLVIKMPEPFTIPADGRDVFRCFVLPTNLPQDRSVAAVEFRPGNRTVVHHALYFLDTAGQARKKEEAPGKGYTTFGGVGIVPTGTLGGWAPGAFPRRLEGDLGRALPKGADVILQIHYHPSGKEEKDQSQLGIYFTKKPAEKVVTGIPMVNRKLYIPAGEDNFRLTTTFTTPVDVDVIGISPHMHLLGRDMKVTATTPDGKLVPLIHIPDWDFNWQGQYQYQKAIHLPKGTRFDLEAVYDNSAKNPRNPNSPPKVVTWGEQTTDEMCLCGIQVVTKNKEDRRTLFLQVLKMAGRGLGNLLGGE
jgi:mono/diheme cytochrome c family protein